VKRAVGKGKRSLFDSVEDRAKDRVKPAGAANLKPALVSVSLVAVLAIVLAVVLFFDRSDSGSAPATQLGAATTGGARPAEASAPDTAPAGVITEDPTCTAWTSINNALSNDGQGIWNDRDRAVPAAAWDDKQRVQYSAAAQSIRNAAAQTVGLVKVTPHRVMRELYEQFIAYAVAYSDRVPKYVPADDNLAGTANSAASALGAICTAIADGSAATRGALVPPEAPPGPIPPAQNPAKPEPFLKTGNPACAQWNSALTDFDRQTAEWQGINPSIPAMLWTDPQKAAYQSAAQVMNVFASNLEQLGRTSNNFVWQDFANLSAAYRRAFAVAAPTYTPVDNHLANAASFVSTVVLGACAVAQGS
jgi:hypothetical protein